MTSVAVAPAPLRAVLALAREERLVEPSRFDTDGVFDTLTGGGLSEATRGQVLQQLLFATELVCPADDRLAVVAGELLDEGYLRVVQSSASPPAMTLSPELVLGTMSAPAPLDWYVSRYRAWEEAMTSLNEVLQSRGLPEVDDPRGLVGLQLRAWMERDEELSKLCGRVNVANSDIHPYVAAHRASAQVLALCERGECEQVLLLGDSVDATAGPLGSPVSDGATAAARQSVLRFVSTRMARRPHLRTVRETIDFARSDEGWEYARQVEQWAEAAVQDSDSAMLAVERTLEKMEGRHRLAGAVMRAGRLTTYCGPAAIAASNFDLPGAAVGVGATLAGAAAQLAADVLTRRMRWFAVLR